MRRGQAGTSASGTITQFRTSSVKSLLGIALVALMAFTAAVVAAPAAAASTKGYTVTNLSHFVMRLSTVETQAQVDGTPKNGELPQPGYQLDPGQSGDFEVDSWSGNNTVVLTWRLLDEGGNDKGTARVALDVDASERFSSISSPEGLVATVQEGGSTPTVLDAPGTVVDSSSLSADTQAKLVSTLCVLDDAYCSFTMSGPRVASSQSVYLHNAQNRTCAPEHATAAKVDLEQLSTRWQITETAKTSVFGLFTTTITATYGQTESFSSSLTSSMALTVPPRWWGVIAADVPVWQYSGLFVIRLANTTWTIQNATWTTPRDDPSGFGYGYEMKVYQPSPTQAAVNPTDGTSC